ncbi:Putative periplasmic protein [Campylobacter concisus ATCC 51562]|uniref:Putative periplasmic protein n=1 Tax=Campylobacter concisus ATCC 51562 TaxID=1242969 RepID=U2F6V3_9BACT|nr:Putative periplasmic protein [Campylobacter concisus ATCC 51562]
MILSFILLLKYGIKINDFEFYGVKLEQLYIKLDKKIIARAKQIRLPNFKKESKQKSSDERLLNLSKSVDFIDTIFQEISLENVQIGDDFKLKILFLDDIFFVDSPYLNVDIKFQNEQQDGIDLFSVRNLSFKDFNVSISGEGSADFDKNDYKFEGNFTSHELCGKLNFALKDTFLTYKAYDVEAGSIKNFIDELDRRIELNGEVKNWIYGYIVADDYELKEINGKADLAKNNFYLNDLNATANTKNLLVKFEKGLPAVNVGEANITLKNSKLKFDLISPIYKGKKLDGSSVVINNIFDEKSANLELLIKTKSIYDEAINEILKAYKIIVPVRQLSGKMDASLKILIKLDEKSLENFDEKSVIANGEFKLSDAVLEIAGSKFNTKNALVKLINTTNLSIDATGFGLEFFKANAKADINLQKSTGEIKGVIESFDLKEKNDEILTFKNEPFSAFLDFSKAGETLLKIEPFGLDMSFGSESKIATKNSKFFIENSPVLKQNGVRGFDELSIKSKDFTDLEIFAKEANFDLPFLDKNGSKYENDDLKILVSKAGVKIDSASKKLSLDIKEKAINVKTKDLNLLVLDDNKTSEQITPLELLAKNGDIILRDLNKTLPFASFSAEKKGKSTSLNGLAQQGRVGYFNDEKSINLDATDISGEFINDLFGIKSFEGGKFRLKMLGENSKNFKAEVRFFDTFLKDYIFYQRLLSFLNSVPSLLSFKTPDFNDKGFTVKNGKILLTRNGDMIEFLAIEMIGTSADIGGRGTIDLKSKKINIDLELKLLKDASSIIDKIPLVNQIILGKDRSLSTVIAIRGTTEKPEYSTQILQDALLSPLKIIRNVIQAPFLIFE